MALDHDGDTATVPGKPYVMRNVAGVLDCSCPAWRNQSRQIDVRTCKHLCAYRGVEVERARVGNENMPTKFKNNVVVPLVSGAQLAASPPSGFLPQVQATINQKGNPLEVLLANKWKPDQDPTGYWLSEKLDGVRAWWDGSRFLSRNENEFYSPDWFRALMPKEVLDGELWIGRQKFQDTMSVVRKKNPRDEEWKQVKYVTFDAPEHSGAFEDRYSHYQQIHAAHPQSWDHLAYLEQTLCKGEAHLMQFLEEIIKKGGEGVMLRQPGSQYVRGRSSTLLKLKRFHDAEAVVIGHKPAKPGKWYGMCGSLNVKMPDGKTFDVSGMSAEVHRNPPPIGTTITYRFTETTKRGIPKCASFVCVRDYE